MTRSGYTSVLSSVAAAAVGSALLLAVLGGLLGTDPATARLRDEARAGAHARLVVIGNSVAETSFDDAALGTAVLGDARGALVLTVSGGGPAHLGALVRGPLAGARPAVVLAWLLPATWRSADPVEGDDLVRLYAIAPAGDQVLAEAYFGGSRTRARWAQGQMKRARVRDMLLRALTTTAAAPYAPPGRPGGAGALFSEVTGTWAAPRVETGNQKVDPDWPGHILPSLQADVAALGAELWLAEPIDPAGHADSRFTAGEIAAVRALGVGLVAAPEVNLPREAFGGGGHVMPGWQGRASEAVGGWLKAFPPSGALR